MLKRVFIWGGVLLLVFSSCNDLKLLNKSKTYYSPTQKEMQNEYQKNISLYDSIAEVSFRIIDLGNKNSTCIDQIIVCKSNVNFSGLGNNNVFHNCDLIMLAKEIENDSAFINLKNQLLSYKSRLNSPDCITIYKNKILIPFKKNRETFKNIYYKSFIYVRNGEPLSGDSISYRVYTN